MTHMWRSDDNLQEVLSSPHVGPRIELRSSGKGLYQLNHLAGLLTLAFEMNVIYICQNFLL